MTDARSRTLYKDDINALYKHIQRRHRQTVKLFFKNTLSKYLFFQLYIFKEIYIYILSMIYRIEILRIYNV